MFIIFYQLYATGKKNMLNPFQHMRNINFILRNMSLANLILPKNQNCYHYNLHCATRHTDRYTVRALDVNSQSC